MKVDELNTITPFNLLTAEDYAYFEQSLDVIYFIEGQSYIINADDTLQRQLIIPFKGRGSWEQEAVPKQIIHPLESAGSVILLEGGQGKFTALEEVLAYRLAGEVFDQLCERNQSFKAHWGASLQEKRQALSLRNQTHALSDFMMVSVQDALLSPIVSLSREMPLRQAASVLRDAHCTAGLVGDIHGNYSIVTTNDLLNAFIDHEADLPSLLDISTPNPIRFKHDDYLFNALLTMTEHNISHLLVMQENKPLGILQQKTLLSAFANQSSLIAQQMERAESLQDLSKGNETLRLLIRSLNAKGVKPRLIADLVSSLNRRLFRHVVRLTQPPHSLDFAMMILGSEGRREQILRTDQDNALIWQGDIDEREISDWAMRVYESLKQLGFPDCPGNIMMTNALWRQSLPAMIETARDWILHPKLETMMNLAILLDADTATGNSELTQQLKSKLYQLISDQKVFLGHFAKSALQFDTPLGLFSQFITEKSQQQRWLDIKKGGIFPIVHGVRVLACEQQIMELTTHERLLALGNTRLLDSTFASELAEALDFMQQLRLAQQLNALENELTLDNHINPAVLNHLQKDMLKDCFRLVDRFKAVLSHHYKLNLIS